MNKKIILAMLVVLVLSIFSGCGKNAEVQFAEEVESIVEEAEQYIEEQDGEDIADFTLGSGDTSENTIENARKLIPLDKDVKRLAKENNLDENEFYEFLLKLTVEDATLKGMSLNEYLDFLKVGESTPALSLEEACVALNMTLPEYMELLNSTMDTYESAGAGEYSELEELISYNVEEVRDVQNSGMMFNKEYVTSSSYDETVEYLDSLVKDTEGYMSMEGIMMGTISGYDVQIMVEDMDGKVVVTVTHFK